MSQSEDDTKRAKSHQTESRTYESGGQRRSDQTAEDTREAQSRTKRDAGHSKGGSEATGNTQHASMRTREYGAGLYNTTLGRDGSALDGGSQNDGSVATVGGADFYAPPKVRNGAPPVSFEFGGQNPPMPTGDTIGGKGGDSDPDFSFKVKGDGDGAIEVLGGSVNTETVAGMITTTKPEDVWIKATVDSDGQTTGASLLFEDPSSDTATSTARRVAKITWSGSGNNTPAIVQGIKGSQNLVSCGDNHGWSSLYL